MKLFRSKPMATRNPIKPMATKDPVSGAMKVLIATGLAVFLTVVVLSYIERGAFL